MTSAATRASTASAVNSVSRRIMVASLPGRARRAALTALRVVSHGRDSREDPTRRIENPFRRQVGAMEQRDVDRVVGHALAGNPDRPHDALDPRRASEDQLEEGHDDDEHDGPKDE